MYNTLRGFLTPQQIAQELQLNILTVYAYIRHNKLPAIRLGRTYRISRQDFNNFLNIHKTNKQP